MFYLYVSCLANSTFSLVLTLTYLVLAWKEEKARLKNWSHLSVVTHADTCLLVAAENQ